MEQQTEEGDWIPISFTSRYLNSQEKKYSTNEQELVAVGWSVDRFKHYLLGNDFVIVTDHKALTCALEVNRSNKTYQSRLRRLVDKLLRYEFMIRVLLIIYQENRPASHGRNQCWTKIRGYFN